MSGNAVEVPPAEAAGVFGDAWAPMQAFAAMLTDQGELRGLIGPRELPRLWSRHLLNSAAVSEFCPLGATVADVGSGAGFPGIVLAIMRPDLRVELIEPMERRAVWLQDVIDEVGIGNAVVRRARAEEVEERFDVVTARAVAALKKLVPWVASLISPGGRLVALKGERAAEEIEDATKALRRAQLGNVRINEVLVPGTSDITRVVECVRGP